MKNERTNSIESELKSRISPITIEYITQLKKESPPGRSEIINRISHNVAWAEDHNADSYVIGAQAEGISVDSFKARVHERVREIVSKSECFVAVSPEVLQHILIETGRFQSQFESGRSGGELNSYARAEDEERLFGYNRNTTPKSMRPIYGFFSDHPHGIINEKGTFPPRSVTNIYGHVIVKIKRSTAIRKATITFQDSLRSSSVPTPFASPHFVSLSLNTHHDPHILDKVTHSSKNTFGNPYTEVQYHGGLTVDDIESVHISPDNVRYDYQVAETRRIVDQYNATHSTSQIQFVLFTRDNISQKSNTFVE